MLELISKIDDVIKELKTLEYYDEEMIIAYKEFMESFEKLKKNPVLLADDTNHGVLILVLTASCLKNSNKLDDVWDDLSDIKDEMYPYVCQNCLYEDIELITSINKNDYKKFKEYINKFFELMNVKEISEEIAIKIDENMKSFDSKEFGHVNFYRSIFKLISTSSEKEKNILKQFVKNLTDAPLIIYRSIEMHQYVQKENIPEAFEYLAQLLLVHFSSYENCFIFLDNIRNTNSEYKGIIKDIELLYNYLKQYPQEVIVDGDCYKLLNKADKAFNSTYNLLLHEKKSFEKNVDKCVNIYEQLKNFVKEKVENNKYIYIKDFNFDAVEEGILKDELFLFIHEHNKKIFKKLLEENNLFDQNFGEFHRITLKFKLQFSKDFMQRNHDKIDVIEDCLNILTANNLLIMFDNLELLEKLLENTTKEKLQKVVDIFKENNYSFECLYENMDILFDKYNLFIRNNTILKKETIKNYSFETLLVDSKVLIQRIDLAKVYNINLRKNNSNDNFLLDSKTFDIFDMYIELGYYNLIRNNLPLCDFEYLNIIKRITIANNLGLDVIDNKTFNKAILSGNGFVLDDKQLNEYIFDQTNLMADKEITNVLKDNENLDYSTNHQVIKYLDEHYLLSQYEYCFDGIIISRYKVIRYFNTMLQLNNDDYSNLIFNAIIHNSMLSIDKLNIIANLIYVDNKEQIKSLN